MAGVITVSPASETAVVLFPSRFETVPTVTVSSAIKAQCEPRRQPRKVAKSTR